MNYYTPNDIIDMLYLQYNIDILILQKILNIMDTIFAPITATISGAVITVRISGSKASKIIDFFAFKIKKLTPRHVYLMPLKHNNKIIDQALLTYFAAPYSYTGEDIIELSIHGSKAIYKKLISLLAQIDGFRPAEAGEFTKRAFINQKIDLLQAEAIDDLISSQTEIQADQALKQLYGANSKKFMAWRKKIIKIQSYFEVFIDFPDEDIPQEKIFEAQNLFKELQVEINNYLYDNNVGEIIREGIKIAIIGPTNSGKSSLINNLAGRDIAITSDIAGTTRDLINVNLDIAGYSVILTDTAGLRDSNDEIEKIGIQKAKQEATLSDFRILLLPVANLNNHDDYKEFINENTLIIANKIDLLNNKEVTILQAKYPNIIFISAKYNKNIKQLITEISKLITNKYKGKDLLITRERHRILVLKISSALEELDFCDDMEIICENLRVIVNNFSKIVGHIDIEEVLDDIFYNFCIGK